MTAKHFIKIGSSARIPEKVTKLIILGLKIKLPCSVDDFSKIPGRQELSGKNTDDFKRLMNQNLSDLSAAQMAAKHFRKIGSSARSPKKPQ